MDYNRILIADDDKSMCQILQVLLQSQGYEVLLAHDGYELLRIAQEYPLDLILVDLMMPAMDGYEAIRQIRNDTRTSYLPILILTARSNPDEVVTGFESGADDYIIKPFDIDELLARIKRHLWRAAQRPVYSPLTGLAGNVLLTEELKYRIKSNEPFALLYIDLDNFKAFNDVYGFARGDRMIRLLADVLLTGVSRYQHKQDFIGHIGGDDFAIITTPDILHPLCTTLIEQFDACVHKLYDPEDIQRGYLQSVDRQGVLRQFPITSISIGVVTNCHRSFTDYEEVSRIATEMKQYAKTRTGSVYEVDQRSAFRLESTRTPSDSVVPTVFLICGDVTLTYRLQVLLQQQSYRIVLAPDVASAYLQLQNAPQCPDLLVIDVRLGPMVHELCATLRRDVPALPVLLLMPLSETPVLDREHRLQNYLWQPFSDQEFLTNVQALLSHVMF